MNKKQIMSAFLKEGFLLPPETWAGVNEKNYVEILKSLKEGKGKKEAPKKRIKEATPAQKTRRSISVGDFINYYKKKYVFLKSILLKKMDAVSINKGKKLFSKTSIIGRVKEKTQKGAVVEDVTGEIEIVTEDKDIAEGDVIGLIGWFKEGMFFPEKIVWPGVPITTNKGEIPDILLTEKVTEEIRKKKGAGELIITPNSNTEKTAPSYMDIPYEGNQLSVLFFRPEKAIKENEILTFFKKRELPCGNGLQTGMSCLIEKIPNILWLAGNKENWAKNYKGIIIISTDKESFYELKKNEEGRFGKT